MKTNRSMAPGVFIPELGYADVGAAATWLCEAFGFAERLRIANHCVQLTLDGASMVVVEAPPQPDRAHAATHGVMVHVGDVDAIFGRAAARAARVVRAPADQPFGERQCTLEDVGGHRWTFSETIADVDPAAWGGELKMQSG
jgi:uncharacterized glyoxalase superfamily protein PhnB